MDIISTSLLTLSKKVGHTPFSTFHDLALAHATCENLASSHPICESLYSDHPSRKILASTHPI